MLSPVLHGSVSRLYTLCSFFGGLNVLITCAGSVVPVGMGG